MSYVGRFQLGQTVTLHLQCVDATGIATLPTYPPFVKVFLGDTIVEAHEMPILDRYVKTGLFRYQLFLGDSYAVGQYQAVFFWRAGSFYGVSFAEFEICAGGHADGAITGMCYYMRPDKNLVVYGTESGILSAGRNPTL